MSGVLRQAEDAYSYDQAGLRALIEAAPGPIILHRDGAIVHANPAALAALGNLGEAALVGRPAGDLVAPCEPEDSGCPAAPHKLRIEHQQGTPSEFEAVNVGILWHGRPATASLLRELSERQQLEHRLLLSEQMATLGTLTAGVAHELNNPLSYVLANLRFIQEELEAATVLDDALRRTLVELTAQASEGAERVCTIVQDLKKFSRVDAEDREPAEISQLLDGAVSMAWNEISHRAQLERSYGRLPLVRGHKGRLAQVFVNLLVNAAQSIADGRATENRIRVSAELRETCVVVEVSDTGAGIAPESLPRIFDPFFTTKAAGIGTGLGLSICRDILRDIGGDISVESTVGKGTTFRVALPIAQQTSVRPRPGVSSIAPPYTAPLRILVIDDEPSILRILQRGLRDHQVSVAQTGRQALELIESDAGFDLVLCDMMMADLSGIDIFGAAKRLRPGVEESFVFMTGGAFTPQGQEFLAGVPNAVLHKPFDMSALRRLVQHRMVA